MTRALGRLRASGGQRARRRARRRARLQPRGTSSRGFREQVGVPPKLLGADPALPARRRAGRHAAARLGRDRACAAATTTRRTWSATSTSSRAPRRASSPAAGCPTAGASSATDVPLLEREVEASVLAAAVAGAAARSRRGRGDRRRRGPRQDPPAAPRGPAPCFLYKFWPGVGFLRARALSSGCAALRHRPPSFFESARARAPAAGDRPQRHPRGPRRPRFAALHGRTGWPTTSPPSSRCCWPSTTPKGRRSRACASSPTSRGAWRSSRSSC